MLISGLSYKYNTPTLYHSPQKLKEKQNTTNKSNSRTETVSLPYDFRYNTKVSFGIFFDPNRTVPHIDYEEYMAMKTSAKQRFRRKYTTFMKGVNKEELVDQAHLYLPLQDEKTMDKFLEISKIYAKYKDQPIICLGRSPKWFLNAALWMKDGINDYKFVAFSKFWYRPDPEWGARKIPGCAPTEKEEKAYRKYLKRIKADPKSIVEHHQKTGKKTVITDYIHSGKGACSFLDLMSRFADEEGILEDFAKSIQIVGIGSRDYLEEMNPYAEYISDPRVPMPEKLIDYVDCIQQEFYNMDYNVFREMLLNQNTNECRSTYYPHDAWEVYQPDRFKTGLVKDMKKVKELAKKMKSKNDTIASFTPAMFDYRNLLNFRILDSLYKRGMLKEEHKSKV